MTWEAHYQTGRPRLWPNEMLVSWMLRRYGDLPLRERKELNVLEVGCGAGGNLRFLTEEGFSAHGIDLAESAVLQAQARGYVALVRDIRAPRLGESFVDVVCEVTCLQHLRDDEHLTALGEVFRMLKPGGRFFSYRLGYGTDYAAIFPTSPPVWLAWKDEIEEQLDAVGFEEWSILEHNREYPREKWAKYLVVEARKA